MRHSVIVLNGRKDKSLTHVCLTHIARYPDEEWDDQEQRVFRPSDIGKHIEWSMVDAWAGIRTYGPYRQDLDTEGVGL